jgi:phospholipase C
MKRRVPVTLCSTALACALFGATFLLTSCGTGSAAPMSPPAVPTVVMVAAPTAIAQGGTSMLTVTASNATQVVISDSSDGHTFTLSAGGGTQAVNPTATTTYTATAIGAGGTATAKAIVTVTANTSAPTVTMVASPTSITQGSSSTLTVAASNATQVVISDNVDTNTFTLGATGGTQAVMPNVTTTYTVTATGPGGTATARAIVAVTANMGAPTVTMVASPTSIIQGSSSTLTVTAANATQIVISDNIDSSTFTLGGTGGTQVVTPSATVTYTATATGAGGSAQAQAVVTVTANATAPTVSMSASPPTVAQGASSTLTVVASNATQVVISDNIDSNTFTLGGTGGTQAVTPSATTIYTATATGAGGTATAQATVTVTSAAPTVTIVANPTSITLGSSSTLTVTASNATQVVISDNLDSITYTLGATGGTRSVSPTTTTLYTATATGAGGTATAQATVTVGSVNSVNHVIFMMQENRTFDTYFGMLNPYRIANGWNVGDDGNTYNVDGIDDKLTTISNLDDEGASFSLFHTISSCLDDMTSAWLESYGDVNRYDFSTTRGINMDGFVHTAENFAKDSVGSNGEGTFTDLTGQRAMAYYEDISVSAASELNYYYYMASQFALSDRWFSPVSSKSTPNRIATLTGGTTQGLVHDPFVDDLLPPLSIETIFQELDSASPPVSWRIYYSLTEGGCDETDGDCGNQTNPSLYPVTSFSDFTYASKYLYNNPTGAACIAPTVASSAVGDTSNSFCIDTTHIAPLSQFFTDANAGTLASFSYIEPAYGVSDEHPGSGQSIFTGQAQIANILNQFMSSASWSDSVFFLSYDEGGGPYDHVPPVPGSSNNNTITADMGFLPGGTIPDIGTIAVNPDSYEPCLPNGPPTTHCDLLSTDPGAVSTDAPAVQGFAAQLGFRLPNMVISPFSRRHYVSHVPMDHTAVIKFIESRFIGPTAHLTNRDAAQPNLLDFFDFANVPWATPPAASSLPVPPAVGSTCTPTTM